MLKGDKRRYLRFAAFLEGTFQSEDGLNGLIMLTNFSREGLKASLNRKVQAGKTVKIDVQLPDSIVPIFAEARIIWIKRSSKEWTYDFDVGLKLEEIDPVDKGRIMEYAYEHWRKSRKSE